MTLDGAARESDSARGYRLGTRRVVCPDVTLARAAQHFSSLGITRVSVLTGLDRIGIPVAAAYRPNSRSVSVHQGKGLTVAEAKVSAVMEALETSHAENIDVPIRIGTAADIRRHGSVVDVAALPRSRRGLPISSRMPWVEGVSLTSARAVWLPLEVVAVDLTVRQQAGPRVFQATTNGLASGNALEEALLHAICELVERDADALWECASDEARYARTIDLSSIDGPFSLECLDLLERSAMTVGIWDITSDIELPVFACLIAGLDPEDGVQPQFGFGCHLDRDIAVTRALTEAAQSRLTVISGARDDLEERGYHRDSINISQRQALALLAHQPRRSWKQTPNWASDSIAGDLEVAREKLAERGFGEQIWVDLTREDIGIPVARVVVPGLEGPWSGPGGEYTPGPRARAGSNGSSSAASVKHRVA